MRHYGLPRPARVALALMAAFGPGPTAGPVDHYLTGDPADRVAATEGGLVLMGGGADVDAAFVWMIERAGGGDFVVLRASGADGYNGYLAALGTLDSVETLVFHDRSGSFDPDVVERVRRAEALFLAGGDQSVYLDLWRATPVEDAIAELVERRVPIGGTSAGLALLGELYFSAQRGTVLSNEALADPYDPKMTAGADFLRLPYLGDTLADSHFYERDRMGRLVAFLARSAQDGGRLPVRGVGVDEATAVAIDDRGRAHHLGSGAAYFLEMVGTPEVCRPGRPLTATDLRVFRMGPGARFDTVLGVGTGGLDYRLSVVAGELESDRPGGAVY